MRVLIVVRADLHRKAGGDTIQIDRTREELAGLGVDTVLSQAGTGLVESDDLRRYDLVHCFNLLLAHQYADLLEAAKHAGIPCLLSPVFWDTSDFERRSGSVSPLKKGILALAGRMPDWKFMEFFSYKLKSLAYNRRYRAYLAGILERFDLILPNAEIEAEHLRSLFQTKRPMHVVYNAARWSDAVSPPAIPVPDRFILSAGRIEYRKNQLNLVRSMERCGIPLLLVGEINPSEVSYWHRCRSEADRRGIHLMHYGSFDFEILNGLYRAAYLHAQPSWFETPGLSTLEAAAAGCPVVCTGVGSAKEYFGPHAAYCDPADVSSISDAVRRTLDRPPDRNALQTFIRSRYTWKEAARRTLEGYNRVLAGKRGRSLEERSSNG